MRSAHLMTKLALAITLLTSFGHVWGWLSSQLNTGQTLYWGIPMVIRGPSNPPAPPAVPAPVPLPPAPQACPASCVSTRTVATTLPASTITLPASTITLPASTITETTTQPPQTITTPGILPSSIAQGSADCVAGDPAMPTPLFNEYGDLACCVPISTRDSSGTMQQAC